MIKIYILSLLSTTYHTLFTLFLKMNFLNLYLEKKMKNVGVILKIKS